MINASLELATLVPTGEEDTHLGWHSTVEAAVLFGGLLEGAGNRLLFFLSLCVCVWRVED